MVSEKENMKLAKKFKSEVSEKKNNSSFRKHVFAELKKISADDYDKNKEIFDNLSLIIAGGVSFSEFESEGKLVVFFSIIAFKM